MSSQLMGSTPRQHGTGPTCHFPRDRPPTLHGQPWPRTIHHSSGNSKPQAQLLPPGWRRCPISGTGHLPQRWVSCSSRCLALIKEVSPPPLCVSEHQGSRRDQCRTSQPEKVNTLLHTIDGPHLRTARSPTKMSILNSMALNAVLNPG